MGLFRRIRGRQPPPPAKAAVGLYGKHPSAADFLRLGDSGGEGLEQLDEWLSRGLIAAERGVEQWDTFYSSAPGLALLLWPSEPTANGGLIMARLLPSHDQSGRRFPLVAFAEDAQVVDGLDRAISALPLHPFFESAEALLADSASMSREQLQSAVQQLTSPRTDDDQAAIARHHAFLQQSDSLLMEQMFAQDSQSPTAQARAKQALAQLQNLQPKTDERDAPAPRFALRCPLLHDKPEASVAFWLALSAQILGWRPRAVLWSSSGALLIFGRLVDKALLALWHDSFESEWLCDLRCTDQAQTSAERLPQAGKSLHWLIHGEN